MKDLFGPNDDIVLVQRVARDGLIVLTNPPAPFTEWEESKFLSVWSRDEFYRKRGWAAYPEYDPKTLRMKDDVPEYQAYMQFKRDNKWATDKPTTDRLEELRLIWKHTPEGLAESSERIAQRRESEASHRDAVIEAGGSLSSSELSAQQRSAIEGTKAMSKAERDRETAKERMRKKREKEWAQKQK